MACIALFFAFSLTAMENDELTPFLQDCSENENENIISLFPLTNLPPELIAHIFSFLEPHDKALNYLIRFEEFQPTTDPIEVSPYYPAVKRIEDAHFNYIVQCCRKFDSNQLTQSEKELYGSLALSISSFMKTTKNKMNHWNIFSKLNHVIPQQPAPINFEQLNIDLEKYRKQIGIRYKSLEDFQDSRTRTMPVKHHYLNVSAAVLTLLAERLKTYPHYYNDRITCSTPICGDCTVGPIDLIEFRDPVSRATLSYCGAFFCVATSLLCIMPPVPWIYPITTALVTGGCASAPFVTEKSIRSWNDRYEVDHEELRKVEKLLLEARLSLSNCMNIEGD